MLPAAVTKMHGTRNDFVVFDARQNDADDLFSTAKTLCDRRSGVGADGLLVILPSTSADVRVRIINADGSEAEMCGNGLRCIARYLSEAGEGERKHIETLGGVVQTEILDRGEPYVVRVNMGSPVFERHALPFANAVVVTLGNPHVVIFEQALDAIDLAATAERLQSLFPSGTNVHLAVVAGERRLDVRHWERGAGMTFACGSGAVACAAAAIRAGSVRSPLEVHVPGGVLNVEWQPEGPAYLTGPSVRVFDAQLARATERAHSI